MVTPIFRASLLGAQKWSTRMLTTLTPSDLRWMERHRERAALRHLLGRSDRDLADMGFHRTAIERALRLPLAADAPQQARKWSRQSLLSDRS